MLKLVCTVFSVSFSVKCLCLYEEPFLVSFSKECVSLFVEYFGVICSNLYSNIEYFGRLLYFRTSFSGAFIAVISIWSGRCRQMAF